MKSFVKKSLSLLLCAVMLFSAAVSASAADKTARLKNIYADNMLFNRLSDTVFEGYADSGSRLTVSLKDPDGNEIRSASTVADDSGKFSLVFDAPDGGYNEYTAVFTCDGKEFTRLTGIVFGVLWIASGQSNMEYSVGGCIDGKKLKENGIKGSKWLRAFKSPSIPTVNGESNVIPEKPMEEIAGCYWTRGDDDKIFNISAVAFFFAEKLLKELDMPVGVLSIPLGGSSIVSWLSVDAVNSDAAVKADLEETDKYILPGADKDRTPNMYLDLAANYNLKIEALSPFRPEGMIWYQGETDVNWGTDRYSRALDLMQRSYTELFSHDSGPLPIIYTQIADYIYEAYKSVTSPFNYALAQSVNEKPEARACTTIYDVPLDYLEDAGAIHPGLKQPVGERMTKAAMKLLYGEEGPTSCAVPEETDVKDNAVFVKLNNCGSGLVCTDKQLKGFSIAGSDGIYVKAQAEIVAEDTVKIYSPHVQQPVSAAYAYSINNQSANLWSSDGDEPLMPVSPFITDKALSEKYWQEPVWADCDTLTAWHCHEAFNSGYFDTWKADKATLEITDDGLTVGSNEKSFAISPVTVYKNAFNKTVFYDSLISLSDYAGIIISVKNNGAAPVKLAGIKIKTELPWYYVAEADNDTVPADGEWHSVCFDLNKINICRNSAAFIFSNDKLTRVNELELRFEGEGSSSVSIKQIEFSPDVLSPADTSAKLVKPESNRLYELIPAFFLVFFDRAADFFKKLSELFSNR